MRSLEQALHEHELIVLRVIGEWWELDLTGKDKSACAAAIAERLQQIDMEMELRFLPPEEAQALRDLVATDGRMPVPKFSRQYGEVRLMGPGRLEREEPWFDPANVAEALWYRGFLYQGFDEAAEGVMEFYFLPSELVATFPALGDGEAVGRVTAETALSYDADDAPIDPVPKPAQSKTAVTTAVDDMTTMLSQAQVGELTPENLDRLLYNVDADRRSLLLTLAKEMDMLRRRNGELRPVRAAVDWLRQSREAQLRDLADAWSRSNWNDLCHTPGLACEGESWGNDPILARSALLEIVPRTPQWFRLLDLVAHIKETNPDFQRPDGNYDTWYIRDVASDAYISGFENWQLVEGRLLRFLVEGPMFWLGLTETAVDEQNPGQLLYRLTERALDWLAQEPPPTEEVEVPLVVQAQGTLLVPHNAGRYQRFQMARISEALPVTPGRPFTYRLTPAALQRAREAGIPPDRVLAFLQEASGRPIPASVNRAITRWSERGVEGQLETAVILRVRDEAILQTLRQNPKTRDYIGENLGPLAATVRLNDWEKLRNATAELGLLLDTSIVKN